MSSNYGYFPWGAEDDPRAPFNQRDPEPITINVKALVNATREYKCEVYDYRILRDGTVDASTRELDIASQQHYGLLELMDELRKRVEKELAECTDDHKRSELQQLLEDTQGWGVDFIEYE